MFFGLGWMGVSRIRIFSRADIHNVPCTFKPLAERQPLASMGFKTLYTYRPKQWRSFQIRKNILLYNWQSRYTAKGIIFYNIKLQPLITNYIHWNFFFFFYWPVDNRKFRVRSTGQVCESKFELVPLYILWYLHLQCFFPLISLQISMMIISSWMQFSWDEIVYELWWI